MMMPELVRLKRDFGHKYEGRYFTVLGITVGEKEALVKRFVSNMAAPINFTILVGEEKVEKDYFKDEDLDLPLMVLVDEKGRIVERLMGYHTAEELAPVVGRLVNRLREEGTDESVQTKEE